MKHSEFDNHAHRYDALLDNSIYSFIGADSDYFSELKIKEVFSFCQKIKFEPLTILNFGCGVGKSEQYFTKYFKNSKLYGFDVSKESIKVARNKNIKNAYFFNDESKLENNFFDLIFISNVLHHVDFDKHGGILKDLFNKLKNNSYLFIYEHNTLNPLTQKVVKECELDNNAKLLHFWYTKGLLKQASFKDIDLNFVLFFPPKFKKLLFLEKYLKWFPVGGQYYIKAKK
jgi:SAM-dependent methyltransferase